MTGSAIDPAALKAKYLAEVKWGNKGLYKGDSKRMIPEGNCGYGREDSTRQAGEHNGDQYLNRYRLPGHKTA